ncbi:MAG: nucleoside hydrolase [Tannerellaceae bacterium]|jgi:purine nucleosidase|nr:nucleoside hydrolase [Tannerellaceae bacterium]
MKKLTWIISIALLWNSCTIDKKVKMILDLDTGIDDATALAYALADPQIDLIGVVASYGNVTVDESVQNTLDILDMLNHKEVPVFRGADRASTAKETYHVTKMSSFIHGENGIGNVIMPMSTREMEQKTATEFILESAEKYGKDLYIVTTGPVTNLNNAIQEEPELKKMVGKIVITGGALLVEGNINPYSEANIFQDPVAANMLFTSGTPITMVGLDITQRTNLTKRDTQAWRNLGTVSGRFFADMVDYYIDAYPKTRPDLGDCSLHDPLAVAVAVHPNWVKTLPLYLKVGTTENDWGRTIGDYRKMNHPVPNIEACVDVEVREFADLFKDYLTQLFQKN